MNLEEIRGQASDELQKALDEAREQQFRMRMAAVTESVENTRQIRELRKRVARINTVLRERTLQAAAPAAKES
ncbi:MAG: 50S ribosomal protein L29 [Planctomycetes bacterium]|nr:50S ribosomal protein L29 [Planctomycetota bacterium]